VRKIGLLAYVFALTGCARHYHATGIVLSVNGPANEVTISHRAIPNYMPAMAMPFRVSHSADLATISPGARVRFDLRASKSSTRVTKLRIDSGPPPDFKIPKPEHAVAVGEEVPDFSLIDEQGRPTRLSDFRGRLTALEFIYTRCPMPDVCPRLSANFALLQKKFGRDLVLLSITIDPDHDTPGVLREYAQRWRANPSIWHFLTGEPDEVRRVADYFGLIYFAEEGAITHTSKTAVIGADGHLIALLEGSSYTARELVDLVGATHR
jgi:protein SCO1/2